MRAYLSISFRQYSPVGFLTKVQWIGTQLNSDAGKAAFPDPWGDGSKFPTRATLTQVIAAYVDADAAAKGGDHNNIVTRDQQRVELSDMLVALAPYLEETANYDRATLGLTGYDIKKGERMTPSDAELMQAPQNLKLAHGAFSGLVMASAHTCAGASGYETQWTEADPNIEANWQIGPFTSGSTRVEISGRTVGKTLTVRMRAVYGRKGPGAWSGNENIIVT